MAPRAKSAETKFLRGDVGVDGASTREEADPSLVEQAKAAEALHRGRTWLGRECLTWLLFTSESTEAVCTVGGKPLSVVFVDKLVLRAGGGDVTEVAVKGVNAPYARLVREALSKGLLVHGARLSLTHGEESFQVSVDAEFFDVKAAKLPGLLQEDEAERAIERLDLSARLSGLLDALLTRFAEVRVSKAWEKTVVPELKAWMVRR